MAIFQNALSGIFALAGVALLWFLQRRTRREDHARETKALLREKAEQLFQELERLTSEGAAAVARISRFAQGAEIADQAMVVDAGRLIALLRMYFPETEPMIVLYEAKRTHATDASMKIISEAAKSYDAEKLKMATIMMSFALHGACSELIADVQKALFQKAATLVD